MPVLPEPPASSATLWYIVRPSNVAGDSLTGAAVRAYTADQGTQLDAGGAVDGYKRIGGPYPSQIDAAEVFAAAEVAGSAAGIAKTSPGVIGKAVQAVSAPLSGIAAVGDFFQRLTQANTWIRVGEVVIGVLLIVAGIAKMTGVSGVPIPV